jgi:hypothetical protein
VDVCVIRKGTVDYLRPFDEANIKGKRLVFDNGCRDVV